MSTEKTQVGERERGGERRKKPKRKETQAKHKKF